MTQPRLFSQRHWAWWLMFAVLVWVAYARLRMLNFPLERDEGEYAYAGQLILQGIPPYELAYNMKFPGTYLAYALIMALFGQTPAGIHLGLLLVTTGTASLLYGLGKRLLDEFTGAVAAITYAVMAISTAMLGYSAHATIFGAFFVTAGLCLWWPAPGDHTDRKGWRLAGAGCLFGLAILMKQHAVFIALWAGGMLLVDHSSAQPIPLRRRVLDLAGFGLAVLLPFGVCCGWLWWAGVFGKFWFWTIDYARAYISIVPWAQVRAQLDWSLNSMFSDCWLWWFGVAGLGVIWLDARLRPVGIWLAGLAVAALLTTVPGFYFRTHYFHLVLPAAALLAGCAVSGGGNWLRNTQPVKKLWFVPGLAYGLVLAVVLYRDMDVVSVLSRVGGHGLHGMEPVPESLVVADYIRSRSAPSARVAVLGSEPQIYFYAHRHSATGYIYIYGLMEPQQFAARMQREMMDEIETNAPEFMVYSTIGSSWQRRPDSVPDIFNWWAGYQTNYDLVGVAEVMSLLETRYYWEEAAARHGPLTGIGLEIYRRKPGVGTVLKQGL